MEKNNRILYFGGTNKLYNRGEIGTLTKMKDKNNALLNIGDIVKISSSKDK